MENMDYETTRQLKTDLNDALRNLKQGHSSFSTARMELDYMGNSSISGLIGRSSAQIDELISKIQEEERSCSDYLQRYCPDFYSETSHYRVAEWLAEENSEEAKKAKDRIAQAEWAIDEYARSKSRELANSFFDGLKRRYHDINTYGVGRPWGTTIRQRMAVAAGLKNEVDSLWELGVEFRGKFATCLSRRALHRPYQERPGNGKSKKKSCGKCRFRYKIPHISRPVSDNTTRRRKNFIVRKV